MGSGKCVRGQACKFAHSLEERREDPKAPLCIYFPSGKCKNGDYCDFKHDHNLRKVPGSRWKPHTEAQQPADTQTSASLGALGVKPQRGVSATSIEILGF
jgi:hypothetical protein